MISNPFTLYNAAVAFHAVMSADAVSVQYDVLSEIKIIIENTFDEACLYQLFRLMPKDCLNFAGKCSDVELNQLAEAYFNGENLLVEHRQLFLRVYADDFIADRFGDARAQWLDQHPEWYNENHMPNWAREIVSSPS